MAENTTSVLRKDPAENITLEDVLYLIQGVGANRDRQATLGQLFESGVLSRIDCKTVELTASTSVSVSKDYTLILVDNNQNSGAVLTINAPGAQSYRGIVDVVVRWRDQQTERIGISIGNGTYYLKPENSEWGRYFIGAEGRAWSHNVSVTDYTVAEEYSGSGTHQSIPREWKVGKKGFLFKASNNGTTKEVELYFNGNWVLSGLEAIASNLDIDGKISGAKYKIDENVLSISGDDSIIGFQDGAYEVGEILYVYNSSNATRKLYCAYSGGPAYVNIKAGCTIPFRCVVAGIGDWKWSPLADLEITPDSNQT